MKRINILELHRMVNEKKEKHNGCYEKVLDMVHNKIKRSAQEKCLRCLFEVPNYVFGFPLFNLNECIEYIVKELKANGFVVNYYFPNKIYISWDFDEINEVKHLERSQSEPNLPAKRFNNGQLKPKMSAVNGGFGNGGASTGMVKYKPSGKLELNLI